MGDDGGFRCDDDRMWLAFKRVSPYAFFGLIPAIAAVIFIAALVHVGIGPDFRYELYPEAKLVLHGADPFPAVGADLSRGTNRIFPIPAALLVGPLTALPVGAAAWLFGLILFLLLALTVWVAGIRDWRIYGLLLVWPACLAAIQSGNVTIVLGLLVAVAWRYRDRGLVAGLAVGAAVALKIFLWPLLVWLVAIRAYRAAALGTALGIAGGFLAVLPFTSLSHFVRVEERLSRTFAPNSYNLVGLLVHSGTTSYRTAVAVSLLVGLGILAVAFGRRSLPLAVSASLVLSPTVWLHYFVLLIVPIAVRRPAFVATWLVPMALWLCPGTNVRVQTWQIAVALAVLAVVSVLNELEPISLVRLVRRGTLPDDRIRAVGSGA
jgi:hypothetical protein